MSQSRRHRRDRFLAALLSRLAALLGRLSWAGAQRFGRNVGRLGWMLSRRDRRRTLDHLGIAFPELSPAARLTLGRASFLHHGQSLGECLHLLRRGCAEVAATVAFEGWEEIERARRSGRPILVLTGHCGNWELLAAALSCRGLGMKVVARELDSGALHRLLLELRERFGTETIERGAPGAAKKLLTTLRGGGALGMLIDQDTKVEGAWVPFFGQPAFTPLGAAKIAAKQNAVVLPTFIERLPQGRHLARVHPALALPADETAATALMTAAIEAQIRRVPAQWVWMHRRWRRQPPAGSQT